MPSLKKIFTLLFSAIIFIAACSQQEDAYKSPQGYNLNKPEKFFMSESLREISGIAFNKGSNNMIYAEQDEDGKLFYFKLGNQKVNAVKFAGHGDYEDLAICKGFVILLRSDGTLFTFPISIIAKDEIDSVEEWKKILPEGEYEGMYADEATGNIYVLCKNCKEDNGKTHHGYIYKLNNDGNISSNGSFTIDIKKIEELSGEKKIEFHPSALSMNPQTEQWYILSSVNKLLVVADKNWNVQQVYHLNPSLFIQPEGMAFDSNNNLYISNEGGDMSKGNILKFAFAK
ncbi:MAG TPA: SdiA-regulated domain-containing protein [Chitinophagaceae bacterium]|nr:SdiA-regulated domain-containing protein [Chitinophagaceae bacterium]